MKKRICLLITLLLFLFIFVNHHVKAENNKFFTISANPAENSNSSMNIVWHTEKGVEGSYVLYTKKTDTSWTNKIRVDGVSSLNRAFAGKNAKYGTTDESLKVPYEFTKNEATLTNLERGTEYMYKITDGTNTSDVRYFKTGNQEFNFVWTSDFHAYYADARRLNKATAAINKCINELNNKVDFIFSTGDIVAHGGTYAWWKQVSEASWMKNYMFTTTLGNHDWMTNVGTTYSDGASYAFMDACFNNPRNGFVGQENICYYFFYGDALFISVNTETESATYLGMTKDQFVKAQQDWVEQVLQNNSAQYIFLFQHYQAFSTTGSFNSSGYTRWHDICDKYGVDIFFSGNSHVYMRSLPIYEGKLSTDPSKGTVYLVAPSSDGERGVEYSPHTNNKDLIVKSWSETKAQAASTVEVTKEGITIKLVNYNGDILDSATILPKRGPSHLVDIDLGDFDKASFENSFDCVVNQNNAYAPNLLFNKDAHDVLRSVKVYNSQTNTVYYEGMVMKNATKCILNNVEKGDLELIVELRYVDSDVKQLTFNIHNFYDWGNIENVKLEKDGRIYKIVWDEEIVEERIKSITIYLDDFPFNTVNVKEEGFELPDYEGEHSVKIVVRDKDGDIVFESSTLNYEVLPLYTVIFIDQNGKEISRQSVEQGSSANPPEFIAPDGYHFIGWSAPLENIQKGQVIQALIEKEAQENPTPINPSNNDAKKGCNAGIIFMVPFILSLSFVFLNKRKR